MHNTILVTFMMVLTAVPASAQFYTITKDTALTAEKIGSYKGSGRFNSCFHSGDYRKIRRLQGSTI